MCTICLPSVTWKMSLMADQPNTNSCSWFTFHFWISFFFLSEKPIPKETWHSWNCRKVTHPNTSRSKTCQQKLSTFKTDRALRASYTPSPARTPAGDKTPLLAHTPRLTPSRTPSKTMSGSTRDRVSEETLTDNLLDLPKRKTRSRATAIDFFWY